MSLACGLGMAIDGANGDSSLCSPRIIPCIPCHGRASKTGKGLHSNLTKAEALVSASLPVIHPFLGEAQGIYFKPGRQWWLMWSEPGVVVLCFQDDFKWKTWQRLGGLAECTGGPTTATLSTYNLAISATTGLRATGTKEGLVGPRGQDT